MVGLVTERDPGSLRERVEAVVKALAPGEVVSYGDVAAQAGYPGAARAVGRVMAKSDGLPWWRVVMHDGRLAPGKEDRQGRLLRQEGVVVENGRVRRTPGSSAATPPGRSRPRAASGRSATR